MDFIILREILNTFGEDYNYHPHRNCFKDSNTYFMLYLLLW